MLNRLSGIFLSGFPPKIHLHVFLKQSSIADKTKSVGPTRSAENKNVFTVIVNNDSLYSIE
jgi:hypothetical protein